jgi:hypothetical protein
VGSTHLLVVLTAALGAVWAALCAWLVGERTLHDRGRDQAARDTEALTRRTVESQQMSRQRLWRVALGPRSDAALVAAWELVRRDAPRLRLTATTGSRAMRLRALAVLARGRDPKAVDLLRSAIEQGDESTSRGLLRLVSELTSRGLLRLVSELSPVDADELLLETLVAGTLSRSRAATELEPRAGRLHRELIKLSRDPDAQLRYWAVTLLRHEMEHRGPADAVRARATDAAPNVRAAVAEALGFAPAGSAVSLLQELLADDVFYVRSHAARAVAQSGDELLVNALLPLLADRNWWVRAAAKESLGALGENGLMVAIAALSHPDAFARDSAIEIIAASGRQVEDAEFVRLAASALQTPELAVA